MSPPKSGTAGFGVPHKLTVLPINAAASVASAVSLVDVERQPGSQAAHHATTATAELGVRVDPESQLVSMPAHTAASRAPGSTLSNPPAKLVLTVRTGDGASTPPGLPAGPN
jgi:hypothetical protein